MEIAAVELDVEMSKLVLQDKEHYLELELPFPTVEEEVKASFDKVKKWLTVLLPVVQPPGKENEDAEELPQQEEEAAQNAPNEETPGNSIQSNGTVQEIQQQVETRSKQEERRELAEGSSNANITAPLEIPFVETEVPEKTVTVPSYGFYQDPQRVVLAIRISHIQSSSLHVLFHQSYVKAYCSTD